MVVENVLIRADVEGRPSVNPTIRVILHMEYLRDNDSGLWRRV